MHTYIYHRSTIYSKQDLETEKASLAHILFSLGKKRKHKNTLDCDTLTYIIPEMFKSSGKQKLILFFHPKSLLFTVSINNPMKVRAGATSCLAFSQLLCLPLFCMVEAIFNQSSSFYVNPNHHHFPLNLCITNTITTSLTGPNLFRTKVWQKCISHI